MKQKRGSQIIKSYRPSGMLRALMWVLAVFFLMVHIPILNSGFRNGEMFFFFIFLLIIDAFFLWSIMIYSNQTFVNIYEDGIELERGASSLFTTWDNLSHFGRHGAGKSVQYGIYLFERVQPESERFAERLFFGWSSIFLGLSGIISLPLRREGFFSGSSVDTDKLLETAFGRDIYHYAPHLFNAVEEKSKYGY